MNVERDKARLAEYREELREAEERFATASADVSELRPIVDALEARIRRVEGHDDGPPEEGSVVEPPETHTAPAKKRRGLKKILDRMMDDGRPRDADAVLADLADHPLFADDLPPRQTINNRLFDLHRADKLVRVEKGVYQRPASVEAQENAGSPQVQTEEPTSAQKPPDEEIAPPRPGHLTNGAGG